MSENKLSSKTLAIAIVALIVLIMGVVLCVKVIVPTQKYNKAVDMMAAGQYEQAIQAFTLMEGYKDSAEMILRCKYESALVMMEDGKYEEAIAAFQPLDYMDSKTMIKECEAAIIERDYNKAIALMGEGKHLDAGNILKGIDYKDSAAKYEECRAAEPYELTNIGDIITFGRYEQDNNRDNGPEELEWRVLDKKDGKVFLMSEKGVEMLPYFAIYWKRSHIGGYLNNSFIKDFTAEEKAMMVEVTVTADKHPDRPETDQGADTKHKLHILSVDEVNKYLPNQEDRVCYATEYLKSELSSTIHLDGLNEDGSCDWWLRTALSNYSSGATISIIGGAGTFGWATHGCRLALRPVVWVQLEG